MPAQIGNTKVYTTKEVERATLYSPNTVRSLFQKDKINSRKTSQGAYEVTHEDLKEYLIREQDIPEDLVDQIIEYRVSNNNVATTN